jgi:hypothetical protein
MSDLNSTKGLKMFHNLNKLLTFILLYLMISFSVHAKFVSQESPYFPVQTNILLKGVIPYFLKLMPPQELADKFPELIKLDSLNMRKEKETLMLLAKVEYIVNKPVGFFDHEQLVDPNYVSALMKNKKVRLTDTNTFKVTSEKGYSHRVQFFFDSENMSTLNKPAAMRAINAARSFDVISQGASMTMLTEKSSHGLYFKGEVSVSSFIAVTPEKTLVINYQLIALEKQAAKKLALKVDFLEKIQALKELQNSFKAQN